MQFVTLSKAVRLAVLLIAGAPLISHSIPTGAAETAGVSESDMTFFYKDPSPQKVARLMGYLDGFSDKPAAQPPMIGFLDMLAIAKAFGTGADCRSLVEKRGADQARELINVSTALWALNSNAKQHAFVHDLLTEYVTAHPNEPATKALQALGTVNGRT